MWSLTSEPIFIRLMRLDMLGPASFLQALLILLFVSACTNTYVGYKSVQSINLPMQRHTAQYSPHTMSQFKTNAFFMLFGTYTARALGVRTDYSESS